MRRFAVLALALCATAATAAPNPVAQKTQLDQAWQARTRTLFAKAIEIPTVANRGQMPRMAELIASELRAGGIPAADIRIMPHDGLPGDRTVSLIARWRADQPTKKPMLVLGHMDVVEAKREDWSFDPFMFREENGYFLGRGTSDMKNGIVATTLALLKLKQSGFKPSRDIILFFTGDEETAQNGARLGTTEWRQWTDAEFALNADAGGGAYTRDFKPLGFGIQTAEKTYQTYFFTARNRGGHSSRPRADNAIYDLADALKRLQAHRFAPMLNETTRAYFTVRARQEGNSALGEAMRRWLANPADGAAADAVEASELEVGQTRTRCVATKLEGGHADNALPQSARATVNCRIMPGVEPRIIEAELKRVAGPGIEVIPDPSFAGTPTPVSPLRADVVNAYRAAVRRFHGPGMDVMPIMSTGATDGSFFRAAGIPVYGTDAAWGISPDDERAHGLDERIPVRAMYDGVLHWEMMLRALAAR
ncbi:MAG TPA: M20/M25/M40 family metallo-hydrolase [Sphingomicrobium sp.]|nr:M20/M25/M40 family metallo-hydrolase [Sphingomicrobium sp.]